MTSFSFATFILASLVSTSIATPAAHNGLRVPTRELQVEQQVVHSRELHEPTLCDEADLIKADIAANNLELISVNGQIVEVQGRLTDIETNLEVAKDDQRLKTRYLKHLKEFPDMEAGLEALEAVEAALEAALLTLGTAQTSVEDSQAVLEAAKDFSDLAVLEGMMTSATVTEVNNVGIWMTMICAALDDAAAECAAAQVELDTEATLNALLLAGDNVHVTITGIDAIRDAAFGSKAVVGGVDPLDTLDDFLRASQGLISDASSAVEGAHNVLQTCHDEATALSGYISGPSPMTELLDAMVAVPAPTNQAELLDEIIYGSTGDASTGLLHHLAEALVIYDASIAALDGVLQPVTPAVDPPDFAPDGASTVAITAAEVQVQLALDMAAQCVIDAGAECQEYMDFLEETLDGTLALARALENSQDDLHESMQAQFAAMQALFAEQTALTADSAEMAECADMLVDDIETITEADTIGDVGGDRKLQALTM